MEDLTEEQVNSIWEEFKELFPDGYRRKEYARLASHNLRHESLQDYGASNCTMCRERITSANLLCDECGPCDQCQYPKKNCICKSTRYLAHLKTVMLEFKQNELEERQTYKKGWTTYDY